MVKYHLSAIPALNNAAAEANGATLREDADFAIIAMTTRRGKTQAMATAFTAHFGCPPPGAREAVTSGETTILASAQDQVFITDPVAPAALENDLRAPFAAVATLTDQSDSWARLVLAGPRVAETLERLSMVDLTPSGFGVSSVARTVFDHINVIVMRTEPGPGSGHESEPESGHESGHESGEKLRYVILTPRSSAEDLYHALLESPPFTE